MGLSWNSWYNPLDNAASAYKTVTGGLGSLGSGKQSYSTQANLESTFGRGTETQQSPTNTGSSWLTGVLSDVGTRLNESLPENDGSVLGTSTGGTGGAGGTGSTANSDDLAYFDQQEALLRSLLSRTENSLNPALTRLGDSYNKNVSDANLQRSRALEDFQVQREDTTRAKDQAIEGVNTNARTLADSLRRMLGMASGSSSSAYRFAAPNAVARLASQNRSNVVNSYGENERDLATAENRATVDFDQLLKSLSDQRREKEEEIRAGITTQKQGILESLANLASERQSLLGGGYSAIQAAQQPYLNQINSANSYLDSLPDRYRNPYNVAPVNVDAPELRDYTVDRQALNAEQQSGQSEYSPYSYFLRRKFSQQA